MVKVKSCLRLCPIPDPKNFLGINEDSVSDSLIVTLGRNLVLRTKVTDLQQLTSWNIRDVLTAPVSYDKYESRYIGIFNNSFLKFWSNNDENYENAKKYKFTSKLLSVLTQSEAESVLVFKNGFVQSVSSAIHSRKQPVPAVLEAEETIVHSNLCGTNLVALVVANKENKVNRIYLVPKNAPNECVKVDLNIEDYDLISYCFTNNGNKFVTFWSNGDICSCRLDLDSKPEIPGAVIMNIKSMKSTQPIAMKSINNNLLVLYGCDPSEEGALLLVADTRLCAIICRQYFKLYTKPPLLWVFANNIVLSMGQYLALVPFQMTSQLLDTRIKTQIPDETGTKTIHWETEQDEDSTIYETHEDKFGDVMSYGDNFDSLLKTLDTCAEVPDSILLSCIKLILNHPKANTSQLLLKVFSFPPPNSGKLKSAFDFELAAELLTHILATDYVLFNLFTSDWTTCILDAYYHRFLLSEDEKTKSLLQELHTVAELELNALLQLTEIKPRMERKLEQLNKKHAVDDLTFSSKTYSYDIVKLY